MSIRAIRAKQRAEQPKGVVSAGNGGSSSGGVGDGVSLHQEFAEAMAQFTFSPDTASEVPLESLIVTAPAEITPKKPDAEPRAKESAAPSSPLAPVKESSTNDQTRSDESRANSERKEKSPEERLAESPKNAASNENQNSQISQAASAEAKPAVQKIDAGERPLVPARVAAIEGTATTAQPTGEPQQLMGDQAKLETAQPKLEQPAGEQRTTPAKGLEKPEADLTKPQGGERPEAKGVEPSRKPQAEIAVQSASSSPLPNDTGTEAGAFKEALSNLLRKADQTTQFVAPGANNPVSVRAEAANIANVQRVVAAAQELGARETGTKSQDAQQQFQKFGPSQSAPVLGAAEAERSSSRAERSEARATSRTSLLRAAERVESALKEVAKSKDGKTISLRLDPPELGSVKVDVSIRDGALHARMVADSGQVAQLLRERAHEMQAMLRKLGLNVDRVSVAVHWEGAQQQPQHNANDYGNDSRRQQDGNVGGFGTGIGAAPVAGLTPNTDGMLDHWVA